MMEATRCPETSLNRDELTQRNNPEAQGFNVRRGESFKSQLVQLCIEGCVTNFKLGKFSVE